MDVFKNYSQECFTLNFLDFGTFLDIFTKLSIFSDITCHLFCRLLKGINIMQEIS